jgi:MFS family permease
MVAGLGLLLTAVADEFSLSRTAFSSVGFISAWSAAAAAPFFGQLMDRYGLRRVLLPSIALFGLAYLPFAFIRDQLWVFFAAYLVLGAMAGSQGPVGYNKILCQWFDRYRGMAIAFVAAAGSGVGYALMPQVINYLIVHFDWRIAYLGLGLGVLCVKLPVCWIFLRENHDALNSTNSNAPAPESEKGLTREEAMRTGTFWKLVFTIFLASTVFYGTLLHLFPMLMDRGVDRTVATTVISMVAVGAIGGQLSAGVLLDRVSTPRVALLFFIFGLMGVLFIHHTTHPALAMAGAVMLGVGQGAELSVVGYITSRLLGLKAFGILFGFIYAGATAAAGLGPLIFGFVYDISGSYAPALFGGEIVLGVVLLIIVSLGPYAYGRRKKVANATEHSPQPAIAESKGT